MTAAPQQSTRPPRRWRALLVLGMLAGLFGMHALGPGGVSAAHHGTEDRHRAVAMAMATAMSTAADSAEFVCDSDEAGHGGGHAQHADATCASGAVGAGPVLPALLPDPAGQAADAGAPGSYVIVSPDGGRAPPSLAELQLLRI